MRVRSLMLSLLLLGLPLRAEALPLEAKIGVLGIPALTVGGEGALSVTGTPLTLAGHASMSFGSAGLTAGWGEYAHALAPGSAIGVLAGVNLDWQPRRVPAMSDATSPLVPGRLGYLVGAFYLHDWGSWWLRVAPNVSLIPLDPIPPRPDQLDQGYTYRSPEANIGRFLLGGPPLVEIGYRLRPGLELGLRSSLTPLRASLTF